MVEIRPSILSADFSKLGEKVKRMEKFVEGFHVDVMDGHFVPNITYGPLIVRAVRKSTSLPIEADLMIENPSMFVEDFVKAGANIVTVHVEADRTIHRTLQKIRQLGASPAVSLNPVTPLSAIENVLDEVDMVLVMTVDPGFGGQKFMESMLPKIRDLRELIKKRKLKAKIEVDGGINDKTASIAKKAGADILVSGSYIYNSKDPASAIAILKK